MIRTMTINSTSNEEFLTKTLEYQQKILCYINQMITKDASSQLLCQGELGLSIGERSEYYIRPQMQGILYFLRQIMQVEERHMYPLQYIVQLINCLVFSTRTKIKEISMPFLFKAPRMTYIWGQILNPPMPYIPGWGEYAAWKMRTECHYFIRHSKHRAQYITLQIL